MPDFTREEVIEIAQKLENVDLRDINLNGADLRGANLSGTDLRGATCNYGTKFPERFDPEAVGMVLVE